VGGEPTPIDRADTSELVPSNPIITLVDGCQAGATITISPPKLVAVVAAVRTQDGNLQAVEIEFPGGTGTPAASGTFTVRLGDRVIRQLPIKN
jgi:hypothetical protein